MNFKGGINEQDIPSHSPPSYIQVTQGAYGTPGNPPIYVPEGSSPGLPPMAPQQAIITTVIPVGPNSTRMICPHCHAEIFSQTRTEPGTIAYLSGLLIALLGGSCGCCLIPCCVDDCMDVHHNCPNCKAYLGRFRR